MPMARSQYTIIFFTFSLISLGYLCDEGYFNDINSIIGFNSGSGSLVSVSLEIALSHVLGHKNRQQQYSEILFAQQVICLPFI